MSLKALSQRLGLSQTTISRALNGYPEVNEKTRQRVQEAARELNYRPNPHAKSLATGRTGHIGLILPMEQNLLAEPTFSEFLAGLAYYLNEHHMDITILPVNYDAELDAYTQLALSGRVDGMVISSPLLQDERVARLAQSGFPCVVHGRTACEFPYSYLDIDNKGAFFKATSLLLDLGHERIGLINGDERLTFAHDRHQGYKAALEQHQISYDPALTYSNSGMREEDGFIAVAKMLMLKPRPSAFVMTSMIHALGALRAIRQHGLEPGRDISLIAHDDGLPYLAADKFDPPLTTIYSPIRPAGYEVAQMLQHNIQQNDPLMAKVQRVLEVELVMRSSTRPRRV
ncbi:MAG: substrate-binding domain-containing protein [Thiofilum sp.]|uniref:LacI family DNA-binding transcriptional regulator n=1 Tax=Thiofilum sp. TaxID=2212733 RepID=UPI0025F7CD07|nr:substrate-binding domain-containing protein [Thiofilum sp.]MBK8452342.1 substrate-binding domain-containing protein [Thiofilum sp.]